MQPIPLEALYEVLGGLADRPVHLSYVDNSSDPYSIGLEAAPFPMGQITVREMLEEGQRRITRAQYRHEIKEVMARVEPRPFYSTDPKTGQAILFDPRKEKHKQQIANLRKNYRKLPQKWLDYYRYDIKAESIIHGSPAPSTDHDSWDSDEGRFRVYPRVDPPDAPREVSPLSTHSASSKPYLDNASELAAATQDSLNSSTSAPYLENVCRLAATRDSLERAAELRGKTLRTPPTTKKPSKLKRWRVKLANMKQKVCDTAEDVFIAIVQGLLPAILRESRELYEETVRVLKDIKHWAHRVRYDVRLTRNRHKGFNRNPLWGFVQQALVIPLVNTIAAIIVACFCHNFQAES